MARQLPPGVSDRDFTAALTQFAAAVGSDWVFSSDADLDLYRDAYSPLWGTDEERRASAAVAPQTVEEVQQVVRIANRYRIPLYPISTGKNLGYGGSAPGCSGSVVVDLKRMNRIVEVDDRRHFAIVEPGVSYFDLYHHIQAHKLRVWIDCPEPGWGSVLGNALDHGVGWTTGHFRDHFGSHCGLEVVLPNGELMRTGMGAMPNADTFAQFPYGFGPTVDGLFGQGNFGIVTRMGIWLMPEPEAYATGKVLVRRRRDLIPLIDVINRLEHSGLIGLPVYDSPLASLIDPELNELTARVDVPDEALDQFAARRSLPMWDVTLQFYGPVDTVAANWSYAKRLLREAIADARFEDGPTFRFPMSAQDQKQVPFRVSIGAPNLEGFSQGPVRSRFNPNPLDGHVFFSPIIPKTGEAALEATRVLADVMAAMRIPGLNPLFRPPQASIFRSLLLVVGLPISRTDPQVNEASMKIFRHAVKLSAERGWAEYRTSPIFSDMISDVYSFNDHALRRFTEALKDAADPNGIIAPGRGGIWPKHLRKQRKARQT
jgi:4-cresol dehydrogenase (hydroxylating)